MRRSIVLTAGTVEAHGTNYSDLTILDWTPVKRGLQREKGKFIQIFRQKNIYIYQLKYN